MATKPRNVDKGRRDPRRRRRVFVIFAIAAIAALALVVIVAKSSSDQATDVAFGSVDIDITMVGDVPSPESLAVESEAGYRELFDHVREALGGSDVRVLAQDSSFDVSSSDESGATDDGAVSLRDAEADAGFNLIVKANDHIFDSGYEGLGAELDYWKAEHPEITVIGTDNPNQADRAQDYVDNVYVYEKDGFRVAFLAYSYGTRSLGGSYDAKYISTLSRTKIERDVTRARSAGADMIVACPYWGQESSSTLTDEETSYADVFASGGVDVVIGTTPHALQQEETITTSSGHKTICLYSLGDFVATGSDERSYVGGLAHVVLHKDGDGSCTVTSVTVRPLVTYRDSSDEGMVTTYQLSDYTDTLAQTNLDGSLTRDYVADICRDLYGSGFDDQSGIYTVQM